MPTRTKGARSTHPLKDKIEELVAAADSPDPNAKVTGGKRAKKVNPGGRLIPRGAWGRKFLPGRRHYCEVTRLCLPDTDVDIGTMVTYKRVADQWEFHVLTPMAEEMTRYLNNVKAALAS